MDRPSIMYAASRIAESICDEVMMGFNAVDVSSRTVYSDEFATTISYTPGREYGSVMMKIVPRDNRFITVLDGDCMPRTLASKAVVIPLQVDRRMVPAHVSTVATGFTTSDTHVGPISVPSSFESHEVKEHYRDDRASVSRGIAQLLCMALEPSKLFDKIEKDMKGSEDGMPV